ncbi:MAG: transcriptional regulator NrdR [Dehalococcoidia bacterium]|nr:transcriptional regulator NrdR [Dehalococcoidia bacterium]
MQCPYCNYCDTKVTDSRETADGIRRRRECLRCSLRFTTIEKLHAAVLMVVKRDQRREEFAREKVMRSLQIACTKRPLPAGTLEKIADEIDFELHSSGKAEISSALIGEKIMAKLENLDRVAYIRYSSVYKDFGDIDQFQQAIEQLQTDTGASSQENQPTLFSVEELTRRSIPHKRNP